MAMAPMSSVCRLDGYTRGWSKTSGGLRPSHRCGSFATNSGVFARSAGQLWRSDCIDTLAGGCRWGRSKMTKTEEEHAVPEPEESPFDRRIFRALFHLATHYKKQ